MTQLGHWKRVQLSGWLSPWVNTSESLAYIKIQEQWVRHCGLLICGLFVVFSLVLCTLSSGWELHRIHQCHQDPKEDEQEERNQSASLHPYPDVPLTQVRDQGPGGRDVEKCLDLALNFHGGKKWIPMGHTWFRLIHQNRRPDEDLRKLLQSGIPAKHCSLCILCYIVSETLSDVLGNWIRRW